MTRWNDLVNNELNTSITFCSSVRTPNSPYISVYKNGTVYIGNSRGSLRLFKNCPYDLMKQIIEQFTKEQQ